MLMTNFLTNRKSVREFKEKELNLDTLNEIKATLSSLEREAKEGDIEFRLYENGQALYDGFKETGGYAGMMIDSPHYILLKTSDDKISQIYGAYYTEKLITELHNLSLGTCWVTLSDVAVDKRAEVLGEEYKTVEYILAIGEIKPRNPFEKETFSERKEVSELVFEEELGNKVDPTTLEYRGLSDLFYYLRFAPSAKNLQPWRFLLKGNKVYLYLEKENVNLMDAGIIMYYFEELAKMIGIESSWKLLDFEEESEYVKIAEIEL